MNNQLLKSIIQYFLLLLGFSIIFVNISKYHINPIKKTNAYRLFGIIPIREVIGLPPVAFIIWYYISKYNNRKINIYKLFIESIIIMFFTGFIIHSIFNVKSELGYRLGFLEKPDGTGIVPYSNY